MESEVDDEDEEDFDEDKVDAAVLQTMYEVDKYVEKFDSDEDISTRLVEFYWPKGGKSGIEEKKEFEKLKGVIMRLPTLVRRELFLRYLEKPEGIATLYGRELREMHDLLEVGKQVELVLLTKEDMETLPPRIQKEIYARYDTATIRAKGGKGTESSEATDYLVNLDDFEVF